MYEEWLYKQPMHQDYTNIFTFSAAICLDQSKPTHDTMRILANPENYTWEQAAENIRKHVEIEVEHWFLKAMADGYRYRRTEYHEDTYLLVCEIKGDAFGHVNWEDLTNALMARSVPRRDPENLFNTHLLSFLVGTANVYPLYGEVLYTLETAYNDEDLQDLAPVIEDPDHPGTFIPDPDDHFYSAVDAVHQYFDEASDEWSSIKDKMRSPTSPMTTLMKGFVEIWMELVDWSDVANQFRREEGQ